MYSSIFDELTLVEFASAKFQGFFCMHGSAFIIFAAGCTHLAWCHIEVRGLSFLPRKFFEFFHLKIVYSSAFLMRSARNSSWDGKLAN